MKLSKKAQQVIELMKNGAFWRHQLETNSFTRREQFKHRLVQPGQGNIAGFGAITFYELEDAKLLKRKECVKTSAYPTEYELL